MIEIKNLTKKYKEVTALDSFNLTIKDNTIFGLVGVNGAGKSTLLRLLSGVFKADAGEILIDGENIYENEKKKRELFFLPDEPFYNPLTNGLALAEHYKTFYSFDESVFFDYIDAYKLDPSVSLRSYSKGMRRQLFVSLAFASSPKYLFLDEAFDGLDPAARLLFKRGLITTMEKSGGTAIISSHSLRELEDICDSYGIIDGKRMVSYGCLSDSLDNTFKFQIALSSPVAKEDLGFDCIMYEQSGRVIKVVVRGQKEAYLRKINELNPLVVDELPIDFEEFFISEIGGTDGGGRYGVITGREDKQNGKYQRNKKRYADSRNKNGKDTNGKSDSNTDENNGEGGAK